MTREKPRQGFWGLWNISFGFFGIQIGFALQNANVSRIFQSLGTSVDDLAFLWIAAPLTGLLVQPVIGHYSDRTWGRLGRRRPYFLGGAVLATIALLGMPNAPVLWVAAALLWMLDGSLNVAMEPFRAFVGDMLGSRQRTAGYAFQTGFIGAGAVIGSLAPLILTDVFHVANTAAGGGIPPSVRYGFYLGAAALFCAVLWTVLTTKEYSPDEMAAFEQDGGVVEAGPAIAAPVGSGARLAPVWIALGAIVIAAVARFGLDKPVYLLGGGLIAFGVALLVSAALVRSGRESNVLSHIVGDLATMPQTMKRLALVQLFTWSALFIMWIYTTPIVTQRAFGTIDTASAAYNDGANWVGVLFAVYNGVATVWAFVMPWLAGRIGRRNAHILGLLSGAAGFGSFLVLRDPHALIGSMVLIGIAWSSILTMPYAMLSNALPQAKLGVYMGLFNIFIVLPQLIVSSVMGQVMRTVFPGDPVWAMLIAAGVMGVAALAMLRVPRDA
ncbi:MULTISPECIES: MFS transporter [unclassified Sphingomonas]|uniref:MFS transporter n=1 Tax=unclassified Sphingomonas TaxID=196159 RepID=UPI0006F963A5|nr:MULTISPECIES: MFS transporter [unclassified Sphingomonas]KQM91752.1 MFS transporter [Sphingomonas sp. Leaf226]MDY0967097.1 MFS transporter [Sphingomonas sp. CFBP9021]